MSQYFFNIWSIPYFLSFLVSFLLCILLFAKKRDDKQVQLYIVSQFFIVLLTLSATMATNSLVIEHWIIWTAMNITTSAFSVATAYHFSYIFLRNTSIFATKKLLIAYLVPLIYLSLYLIDYRIFYLHVGLTESSQFGLYVNIGRPISSLLSLFFYGYLGIMAILMALNYFRMFRQKFNLELRRRAAYFVISSLIPAITITLTVFLALVVPNYHPKLELTIVSLSISGSIVAYGILKDQLFDIDLIVSKSVKYTLMNIGLAWVFVLSREIMIPLISELVFRGSQVATLLAGFLVVTFSIPIKNVATSFTDRFFPLMGQIPAPALAFYREQLALAFSDRNITEKEQLMLDALKFYLKIPEDIHEQLEREALSSLDN